MTLDTVVLDVDGTLVDSVYARTIAWKAAFREVGVEVPSHRIHRAIGMGGDRVVPHLAGDAVAQGVGDAVARRQTEYFERLSPEVSATEGAADLLSLLRERGLRVVIASSGEPHITSRLLELVDGAPGLVHRIDGGSLTARSKPAPDLLHSCRALAKGRRMGSADGRDQCRARQYNSDDRQHFHPGAPAGCDSKKWGCRSLSRPITRRPHDQDSRRCRRARPPNSARPNSRTGARADRQHAARPPWPRHHRAGRQGL